jgi:hypothetical protein
VNPSSDIDLFTTTLPMLMSRNVPLTGLRKTNGNP